MEGEQRAGTVEFAERERTARSQMARERRVVERCERTQPARRRSGRLVGRKERTRTERRRVEAEQRHREVGGPRSVLFAAVVEGPGAGVHVRHRCFREGEAMGESVGAAGSNG